MGEMGVGKTTLIKSICNKLNVIDVVTSPTFSIVNEYATNLGKTIYHFDFYRVNNNAELQNIGVHEYLDNNCYCFVEWPMIIKDLLDCYLKVNFVLKDDFRIIEVTFKNP